MEISSGATYSCAPKFGINNGYPKLPSNASEWNHFWTSLLARSNEVERYFLRLNQESYSNQYRLISEQKYSNILAVGNGISVIPQLFASIGYSVVSVDISSVAVQYCLDKDRKSVV